MLCPKAALPCLSTVALWIIFRTELFPGVIALWAGGPEKIQDADKLTKKPLSTCAVNER